MSLEQLIDIRNLSILLLIIYEILFSSVLVFIANKQLQTFEKFSQVIDEFPVNVLLIEHELNLRHSSTSVIESLKFSTLLKAYEFTTLFSEYIGKKQ